MKAPTTESADKVLNNTKERLKFKDEFNSQFVEWLGDSNLQDINDNGFYHRQCYQEMINRETLKKSKKDLAISLAMSSLSKRKKVNFQWHI